MSVVAATAVGVLMSLCFFLVVRRFFLEKQIDVKMEALDHSFEIDPCGLQGLLYCI